jgi:hypothetical protein
LLIRDSIETILRAWKDAFDLHDERPDWSVRVSGPELHLDVRGPEAVQALRGRLSAFGLLCGRFWATAVLDAETLRICPAWLPSLREASAHGLGAVLGRPGVRPALLHAADVFEAAGEVEEAALLRVRASWVPRPAEGERGFDKLVGGLKHADPAVRLQAVRSCESAFELIVEDNALRAYGPFRNPLRALLSDTQPALHERALALTEAWARRLAAGAAWKEAMPLLDTLVESGVAIGYALRLRHEGRLLAGDLAGARNDLTRLKALQARLAHAGLTSVDSVSLHTWHVGAFERVARAHLDLAAGRDPCPDREGPVSPPAKVTALRHLGAARDRVDDALSVVAAMPSVGDADALRRLRAEASRMADDLRARSRRRRR